MGFDKKAFLKTQFTPREEGVKLPALKQWFGADNPVWIVRGMTAIELANAENASTKAQHVTNIVELVAKHDENKIAELKDVLGLTDNTPAVIAKRLEHLVTASITPAIDMTVAVKLAETFPIEFLMLTNKISELTGLGMDIKKS